jgi:hypothetical protein
MLALLATALLYALHQDFWFWREARPLVFGFLPIGLFYHAAYTVATSGLLWMLVRSHWPAHLETTAHHEDTKTNEVHDDRLYKKSSCAS